MKMQHIEKRCYRLAEVLAATGMKRSFFLDNVKRGVFPAQRKFGKLAFWTASDVDRIEEILLSGAGGAKGGGDA